MAYVMFEPSSAPGWRRGLLNLGLTSPFVECNDRIMVMHPMHLTGIDLNLALVLHAVLEEKSVSRAARQLGLSQSATSHALARLRNLLEDPVVVRTPEGLVPTPRAQQLAPALTSGLQALEQALLSRPAFEPASAQRSFRLGASDYAEFLLLPPLLERVGKNAPLIDLWAVPLRPDQEVQLATGDLDIAIGLPPSDRLAGLHLESLFEERFVCLVRKGHPLTRGKMTVTRFAKARHALIAPRGRPGGAVDSALEARGLTRRVSLAVPHFLVAPPIVARTDLVLTIAERIAQAFREILPLTVLEPPLPLPRFTVAMMWHHRTHADPACAWLRSTIREAAGTVA
jgi:DNA-binding transcriptional LysR family regulator